MVEIERYKSGAIIWLNRPEKKNALNREMIAKLSESLTSLERDDVIRYVVIRGKGEVFSAGADINWMKGSGEKAKEANEADARVLADIFHQIYNCSKPTLSIVHGAAFGGAMGILAPCDIVYCAEDTVFSFSEIKLGIVPATISPFVAKRIGTFQARELMFTGRRFDGKEAERIGLVNKAVTVDQLDDHFGQLTEHLEYAGPEALKACKKLLTELTKDSNPEDWREETTRIIAEIRTTEEAKEGFSSFLEKRKPKWIRKG